VNRIGFLSRDHAVLKGEQRRFGKGGERRWITLEIRMRETDSKMEVSNRAQRFSLIWGATVCRGEKMSKKKTARKRMEAISTRELIARGGKKWETFV